MRRTFITIAILGINVPAALAGEFIGKLEWTIPGCEAKRACLLKSPFGYKDSSGTAWEASTSDVTDGASIPPPVQGLVGKPFDADLIRAAVIHDHYCGRYVRSWSDTHWVFFDALLASGVQKKRANWMYAGVLIGGPKWIWLIRGDACEIAGKTCIKQVPSAKLPSGGKVIAKSERPKVHYREARYQDPGFAEEMKKAEAFIDSTPDGPTREQMEDFARSLRPSDPFLNGPDQIVRIDAEAIQ